MVGDLSLAGYNDRMWATFPKEFEKLYKTKTVKLKSLGRQSDAKINLVSKDLSKAIIGTQVICSTTPAFAKKDIYEILGPFDRAYDFSRMKHCWVYKTAKVLNR